MIICPICFNFYRPNEDVISLKCGHLYHKSCIQQWFSSRPGGPRTKECPHCRKRQTGKFLPVFAQFDLDANAPENLPSDAPRSTSPSNSSADSGIGSASGLFSQSQSRGDGSLLKKFDSIRNLFSFSSSSGITRCSCEKKDELKRAEKEIEELFKQFSDKNKLLEKSQEECATYRAMSSRKDELISTLTNQFEASSSSVRELTNANESLQASKNRLSSRIVQLERSNERLTQENKSLGDLKRLIPVRDLLDKKQEEVSVKMQHFKTLSTSQDDAFGVLANYCILMDVEAEEKRKENCKLKQKIKQLERQSGKSFSRSGGDLPSEDEAARNIPLKSLTNRKRRLNTTNLSTKAARISAASVQGCSSSSTSTAPVELSEVVKSEESSSASGEDRLAEVLNELDEASNSSTSSFASSASADTENLPLVGPSGDNNVSLQHLATRSSRKRGDTSAPTQPLHTYESGGVTYEVVDDEISVQMPELVDLIDSDDNA